MPLYAIDRARMTRVLRTNYHIEQYHVAYQKHFQFEELSCIALCFYLVLYYTILYYSIALLNALVFIFYGYVKCVLIRIISVTDSVRASFDV